VGPLTKEWGEDKGLLSRVLGAFSLINVLWAFGLLGLMVFIGPFLYYTMEPIFTVVLQILTAVWVGFVWPLLVALVPAYEGLGYVILYIILTEAYRYPPDAYSMMPVPLAGTACGLFIPLYLYSTVAHAPTGNQHEKEFLSLSNGLLAVLLVPHAVTLQSEFLGFMAVVALCAALGFSIACWGLCWVIGFADGPAMLRTAAACLLLNAVYVTLRVTGTPLGLLRPFASGIGVFGGTVCF